jgi:hypothetical protein
MIVILLALLGIPLWLLVGGLLATLVARRRRRRTPGMFLCKLRTTGPEDDDGWPRTKSYACWAHDVLLVHHGLALVRYEALPVASVGGPPIPSTAKGVGDRPVSLRLHLDDGRVIELATPRPEATTAAGPFDAPHAA